MIKVFYAGLILLLTGCFAKDRDKTASPAVPLLPVITLKERDTALTTNYVAAIQALRNVEIRTKMAGSLEEILVDEGHYVKKGQALFRLSDEVARVELERSRANLESQRAEVRMAELEIKRVNILVDKNVISPMELDLAKAKMQAVQARVEEASAAEREASIRLSYTTIRAPFDGVTNRIPLKRGSYVDEGQLLTTVSDVKNVYAYFDVSEIEYLHYIKSKGKSGSKYSDVSLQMADGTRYPHPGKIETIEGEIDNSTGSIAFRARFPNPDQIFKHGSSGKVTLTTTLDQTLLVPQKAVFEVQDKNYVFLVRDDETVEMHSFTPLTKIAQSYVVGGGLKAGDRIVYEGLQSIKHGSAIRPKELSLDSLAIFTLNN